mmetsp:Transcript_87292/g.130990  ORF Transcript_87292/g.130990 Transcript_87292/m.130990 type:complete len:259 (-) Transcript_87292:140-916(-)
MVGTTRSGIFVCLVSLLFQNVAGDCTLTSSCCNVCRNGGHVLNPGHNFVMEDPATDTRYSWSCGYLEEAFASVNTQGAPGEAFYCALGQLWSDLECECSGEPAPPNDNVVDPNPRCDLCGAVDGAQRALSFVPELLKDELVDTGVAGRMPCGGLYYALSEGILTSNLCPTVKRNAGEFCCNPPSLGAQTAQTDPPEPENQCLELAEDCENGGQCCPGMQCRVRGIGIPKICSRIPRSTRASVARNGAGGAAGRAKGGR